MYKKGRIDLSEKGITMFAENKEIFKINKNGILTKKVNDVNHIDNRAIEKYKGKPVWVAFDIDNTPVSYEGCISSNFKCDYINAHAFIMAQLIKVDSISQFAALMGEDAHGIEFLRLLNRNDRNLEFWESLAVKWFSAKWMGEQDEQ